jgi:hypothetical protein
MLAHVGWEAAHKPKAVMRVVLDDHGADKPGAVQQGNDANASPNAQSAVL